MSTSSAFRLSSGLSLHHAELSACSGYWSNSGNAGSACWWSSGNAGSTCCWTSGNAGNTCWWTPGNMCRWNSGNTCRWTSGNAGSMCWWPSRNAGSTAVGPVAMVAVLLLVQWRCWQYCWWSSGDGGTTLPPVKQVTPERIFMGFCISRDFTVYNDVVHTQSRSCHDSECSVWLW